MSTALPGLAALSLAPPIGSNVGTPPEVPVNAATLGIPPPDCGPKASPVIGADGQWTCQSNQPQSSNWLLLAVGVYLLYEYWWKPNYGGGSKRRRRASEAMEPEGDEDDE